jgi:hypothetical protein
MGRGMRFLFQPFGKPPETHGPALRDLLDDPDLGHFLFAAAFVRSAGVDLIEPSLKKRGGAVTFFAGINNGVTSVQGLTSLVNAGASVFTFDTGSTARIFHPKIFLGWGEARARLIIGSANLTLGGLGNNIEASVALDLDLKDGVHKAFVEAVRAHFAGVQKDHPDHCAAAGTLLVLQALYEDGRLEDEDLLPEVPEVPSGKSSKPPPAGGTKLTAINLPWTKAKPPKKPAPAPGKPAAPVGPGAVAATAAHGPLVWAKASLKGTDAQQPPTANTNPTGNLRLAAAQFQQGGKVIDKNTYFRKTVFGGLTWSKSKTTEYATGSFNIVRSGKLLGSFDLKLSHDLKRVANQNNVPTVLHWGDAIDVVRKANVKGLTLRLYDTGADGRYTIEFA